MTDLETLRAEFEADVGLGFCRKKSTNGEYVFPSIADRWAGYRAAAIHQQERVAQLEAEVAQLKSRLEDHRQIGSIRWPITNERGAPVDIDAARAAIKEQSK